MKPRSIKRTRAERRNREASRRPHRKLSPFGAFVADIYQDRRGVKKRRGAEAKRRRTSLRGSSLLDPHQSSSYDRLRKFMRRSAEIRASGLVSIDPEKFWATPSYLSVNWDRWADHLGAALRLPAPAGDEEG